VKYLSSEQVLFIHSRIIDATGGAHGIRDIGLLQSAVARPRATFQGKDLYRDVFSKAAALMESISQNHAFIDGNKRTAISSAAIFLQLNGYNLEADQKEVVIFAVSVATGKSRFEEIMEWLRRKSLPVL
jgi:death on curing protein